MNEWVGFNIPINTLWVILETGLSRQLHWYWQPNQNEKKTECQKTNKQNNATQCGAGEHHNRKHTQKKPRIREKTEPDLVILYDIQLGNGSGLFFLPRSLHGAWPQSP